jgi:cell division cycle 2-like protein
MLEGMRYLHENWVLHRDLKPANVLYDHLGNIKICDFGLARHFGNPVPNMTPTVVTPTYRGPEICLGVRDYTPALDIWSVGIMAAELISGKTPFIEYKSELDLVNSIARVRCLSVPAALFVGRNGRNVTSTFHSDGREFPCINTIAVVKLIVFPV